AFAASLACGYLGMKQTLVPRPSIVGEAYDQNYALPRGLLEALDAFEEEPMVTEVLGREFCDVYAALKRHEAESFLTVISPWERQHLLLSV
ncbi:MAG: glutamine synthetase, partial [Pseudomonadota bacterium]